MERKAAFCYFQEREEVYLYTYNISFHISIIALVRLALDAHVTRFQSGRNEFDSLWQRQEKHVSFFLN